MTEGGKTCFLPTVHARNNGVSSGDYRDVLTFRVVTKS